MGYAESVWERGVAAPGVRSTVGTRLVRTQGLFGRQDETGVSGASR